MKRVDDFRLRFGKKELVPIVIGGMGVDISTAGLALEARAAGRHRPYLRCHDTDRVGPALRHRISSAQKAKLYKYNVASSDKSKVQFDLGELAEATRNHVGRTMEAKRGDGMIFINCMEKLTMNAPRETLRVRLDRRAGCRHRRHHAVRRAASRFVRADRGSSAFSRCQAGHHRLVAARAAAVPAQERQAQPAAGLSSSWKGRWPAATSVSAWTGRNTTCARSWPRSSDTCRPNNWTSR